MKLDEFTFDPIKGLVGFAGILLGIGAITLHQSRAITALTALVLMLIAHTDFLSFKFTSENVRVSAFAVKLLSLFVIVVVVFSIAAVINSLGNILV